MGEAQNRDKVDRKLLLDDENLSIWRQILQPGEVTPWHYHRSVTDSFVGGKGVVSVDTGDDGIETLLAVGQHFAVTPGTRHRVRNVGNEPATFITVQTGDVATSSSWMGTRATWKEAGHLQEPSLFSLVTATEASGDR